MNKLEKKIINRVYKMEAKNTAFQISLKVLFGGLIVFMLWLLGSVMLQTLEEQRSFDFINIFKEDGEVIRKYLLDSLMTFYSETPKTLLLMIFIMSIIFIFIILTIIKNFAIIVNKLKSIYKFYKKKI